VKYFYAKAVNDKDDHDEVTEEQFRYDGTTPDNRESAVIMIADSVEAAVRSISSPSKLKMEEMVKRIIDDKIADGQLDNCDITLKDLKIITEVFLKVLNGIYHDRIEYPDSIPSDKGGDIIDPHDR
jgi:membrane-associated HD superfamily phosphohydrolase